MRLWGEDVRSVVITGTNITPLVSVAATLAPDMPNASIAWVDDGSAFVRTVDDLDDISNDDGTRGAWDVGPALQSLGGPNLPIRSIALRRMGAPGDLALLLTGDENGGNHGAFGALVADDGTVDGAAAPPGSGGAGPALHPAVITGRPGSMGRHLFRVLPLSGPQYGSIRVETSAAAHYVTGGPDVIPGDPMDGWAVASDHYLALVEWDREMFLWTGNGNPVPPPGTPLSTDLYASDITFVETRGDQDIYVLSSVTDDVLTRRLITCVLCTDSRCSLTAPADCSATDETVEPSDGTPRNVVATDHAPGIGFVQITAEADSLVARFFGPDLAQAADTDGSPVEVELARLDGETVFALDVDTIRRNDGTIDRTTVVYAFGTVSATDDAALTMGTLDVAITSDCSLTL